MTLDEYILTSSVQSWAKSQGYDRFMVYPTGDPMLERDGKSLLPAVPLEEFYSKLKNAVNDGSPLEEGVLEENLEETDDLIISII